MATNWLEILKGYVDGLETAVGAIEGGTTLHNKLTAVRAALLDQITALRMAELDAANIPTDLADILAEVAGLDGAAMRGTDNAALAASWTAALATALGSYTAARAGYLDTLNTGTLVGSRTSAFSRLAGITQIFTKQITSAANVGDVVVATITTQPCFIKRIVLRSNGATTADLTNAAIYGGAGKVVTFIDSVTGVRANIAAADQQVSWVGAASLAATKTIVITLTGTGAIAVNLQIDIEYEAVADGGYLA